jgi:hypothetical protein
MRLLKQKLLTVGITVLFFVSIPLAPSILHAQTSEVPGKDCQPAGAPATMADFDKPLCSDSSSSQSPSADCPLGQTCTESNPSALPDSSGYSDCVFVRNWIGGGGGFISDNYVETSDGLMSCPEGTHSDNASSDQTQTPTPTPTPQLLPLNNDTGNTVNPAESSPVPSSGTTNENAPPSSATSPQPIPINYPVTAGTPVSYDLGDLQDSLQPDQTIIHDEQADKVGETAYSVVSDESVLQFESDLNQSGQWLFNDQTAAATLNSQPSSNAAVNTIMSVLNDTGLYTYLSGLSSSIQNDEIGFIEANGQNYNTYNNTIDYVENLSGGASSENIENIYNEVESELPANNTPTTMSQSMAQALENGVGVCRNQATLLAEALAQGGYDSSIVFTQEHMWVRVDYGGQTFDLDPNLYQTYIQLPPRTVLPNQIIPVGNYSQPSSFLQSPFVGTAYAAGSVAPVGKFPVVSINTAPVKLCAEIGVCLYIQEPAFVQANSSTTLEIWQTQGNEWSIVTLFKDPSIRMDFTKVHQPTSLNVFSQNRKATEFQEQLHGSTVYFLYTDFNQPNGDNVMIQAISNRSILQNDALRAMLAGENYAAVSSPIVSSLLAPPFVLIMLSLLIIIVGIIGFMVYHHSNSSIARGSPQVPPVLIFIPPPSRAVPILPPPMPNMSDQSVPTPPPPPVPTPPNGQ